MTRRPASLLALAAVAALAVAAHAAPAPAAGPAQAAAAGPKIAVDKACYVRTGGETPRMHLTGSGFEPGDQVTITDSSGTLDATTTASATGTVDARFAGPALKLTEPGQRRDVVTAAQRTATGATLAARIDTFVSIVGAGHGTTRQAPGLKALREKTDWTFSGWPVGRTVYVHYLLHHKPVAKAAFGRASGPCGTLTARRPLYPGTPHASSYATQVDTAPTFSTRTRPRVTALRVGLQLEF